MARQKHSKKEIEEALKFAESQGWKVLVGGSHAWGKLHYPYPLRRKTSPFMAGISGANGKAVLGFCVVVVK